MSGRVYPAMITLAREARGYSQTRLSELSGISQAHLSKIEASLIDASPEIVSVVAKALRMPERFFKQPDEVLGPGTSEFFHRKRQNVPAGVLRQIHAQINIFRMRRFTRLTNGFSKKLENHIHMVALYTVFYNWTKVHKTLRTTPAIAAGLTDRVWNMIDIVGLIEDAETLAPAAQAN